MTEDNEIVEAMARAMCKEDGLDWDAQAHYMTSAGGSDDEQSGWLARARAALRAYRKRMELL